MFRKPIPVLVFILLILSLLQGNFLRRIGYDHIPETYVILDEHTNVWHGLSLRKTGLPTAWSILDVYKNDARKFGSGGGVVGLNIETGGKLPTLLGYKNAKSPVVSVFETDLGNGTHHVPLVQPYLDHPPLGALVLSLGVSPKTASFKDLSDYDMRKVSIYLALVTQMLIAILAYQLTKNYLVALVASFSYATAPSFLLLSRYAQLENVLTPLILMTLILLVYLNEKRERLSKRTVSILLIAGGVIAGLAALTKLAGWISIVSGIFLLWHWKFEKKLLYLFSIPAIFLGLLYFMWGLYLSPKLFMDLFLFQGVSRGFIGSINLLVTIFGVSILNFPFDGWWIGGFLGLLFLPRNKNLLPIYVSVILILSSALILVGSNFPWYFIPLIPFMCISIGLFFNSVFTSPNLLNILTMFFVFVSSSFYWGYGVFYASLEKNSYQQPFGLYRAVFLAFLITAVCVGAWAEQNKYKRLWRISMLVLFVGLFLLNHHGIYFILDNWGSLPSLYTPGTF